MSSRRLLAHAAHRKYDINMADLDSLFSADCSLLSGTIVSPTKCRALTPDTALVHYECYE
jgi:hypothetical protein